jgi:hypothetical protein
LIDENMFFAKNVFLAKKLSIKSNSKFYLDEESQNMFLAKDLK